AVGVENLYAIVATIGHVDVVFGVYDDRMRSAELAGRRTPAAPSLDKDAVLIEFRNSGRHRTVGYKDVPGGVPSDIRRSVEIVSRKSRAAASAFGSRRAHRVVDRFGLSAHGHHDMAFRIKFDDHIGAFVHHPNIVLRINAHGVRLDKTIESLPDFADIFAVLIEFE